MGIEAPKHGLTGKGSRWSPLDNIDPARAAKIKADIAAAKARREAGDTSGHQGKHVISGTKGMNATQAVKAAVDKGYVPGKGEFRSDSQGKSGKWVQTEGQRRKEDPYGEKEALRKRNERRAAEGLPPLKG